MKRSFWARLGDIFAPRATITRTINSKPVNDQQHEAFDEAFAHMDRAFEALAKLEKARGKDQDHD